MEIRNLKYNQDGSVDCEIKHSELGWIPFTAYQNDVVSNGAEIYKEAIAGTYGIITPYTGLSEEEKLDIWRNKTKVSKYQFSVALFMTDYLTDFNSFISMSGNEITKLAWENTTDFLRSSIFIENLITGLNIQPSQMDDIFKYATTIQL